MRCIYGEEAIRARMTKQTAPCSDEFA